MKTIKAAPDEILLELANSTEESPFIIESEGLRVTADQDDREAAALLLALYDILRQRYGDDTNIGIVVVLDLAKWWIFTLGKLREATQEGEQ